MTRYFLLAFCLCTLCLGLKTSAQHTDRVLFSGQIKNASNDTLVLYDVNNNKKTISVDDRGYFSDTVEIAYVAHHRFIDDKKRLTIYFEKGKNLHLTYDANDFNTTLKFTGAGAAANNYIFKKDAIKAKQASDTIIPFMLSEAAYKTTYLSLKKALLKELSETSGLSTAYKKLETKNINYEYLYFLSQYELVQVNHLGNKDFKASKSITDELKDLEYTNEDDFLFSDMYRNLTQSTYYERAGAISKTDKSPRDITYLRIVAGINNKYIKNYLLYNFASKYLNFSVDQDAFYQAFIKGSSNEAHKAAIATMYQAVKKVVENAVSPKFVNYENYAGGTSSLDDFKGKYVFIDIWATWCGPCIYEFPYLDTLEKSYKGKDIQFITVSIDTKANREKWRAFVNEKDLDGVQLLADDAFQSAFVKAYNINGIPRFLIIDPDGKIVSNNAPRPSDPKLRELLDSLPL